MPTRVEIERRLIRQLDLIASAARRKIAEWIRAGVPLEQILTRITQLPFSGTLGELEREIRTAMEQIYRESVTGKPSLRFDAIFAKIDLFTPAIRASVRRELRGKVQKAIDEHMGVRGLQKELESVNLSGAFTLANTSLAGFNNQLTIEQARQAGIDTFLYDGPVNPNSRPFCKQRVGKVYTLAQLRAMDNGQGLPVEQYLGGYNCVHFLTAWE